MENIQVIAEITVSCVFSVVNLAPGLKCVVEWKNDYFQGKTNCVKADKSGNVLFNKVTTNATLLCNPSSLGLPFVESFLNIVVVSPKSGGLTLSRADLIKTVNNWNVSIGTCKLNLGEHMIFSVNNKPGPFTFSLKHIELQSAKGIPQYKNQDIIMKGDFEYTIDRCKYGDKYWVNAGSKWKASTEAECVSKGFSFAAELSKITLSSSLNKAGGRSLLSMSTPNVGTIKGAKSNDTLKNSMKGIMSGSEKRAASPTINNSRSTDTEEIIDQYIECVVGNIKDGREISVFEPMVRRPKKKNILNQIKPLLKKQDPNEDKLVEWEKIKDQILCKLIEDKEQYLEGQSEFNVKEKTEMRASQRFRELYTPLENQNNNKDKRVSKMIATPVLNENETHQAGLLIDLALDNQNVDLFDQLLSEGLNEIGGFINQKSFHFQVEEEEEALHIRESTMNAFLESLRSSIVERKSKLHSRANAPQSTRESVRYDIGAVLHDRDVTIQKEMKQKFEKEQRQLKAKEENLYRKSMQIKENLDFLEGGFDLETVMRELEELKQEQIRLQNAQDQLEKGESFDEEEELLLKIYMDLDEEKEQISHHEPIILKDPTPNIPNKLEPKAKQLNPEDPVSPRSNRTLELRRDPSLGLKRQPTSQRGSTDSIEKSDTDMHYYNRPALRDSSGIKLESKGTNSPSLPRTRLERADSESETFLQRPGSDHGRRKMLNNNNNININIRNSNSSMNTSNYNEADDDQKPLISPKKNDSEPVVEGLQRLGRSESSGRKPSQVNSTPKSAKEIMEQQELLFQQSPLYLRCILFHNSLKQKPIFMYQKGLKLTLTCIDNLYKSVLAYINESIVDNPLKQPPKEMIKEMGINCQQLRECKSYFMEKIYFVEQQSQEAQDQQRELEFAIKLLVKFIDMLDADTISLMKLLVRIEMSEVADISKTYTNILQNIKKVFALFPNIADIATK